MDLLKVVIDKEKNLISVMNNGQAIPVAVHKEHKIYVPQLIFGVLLTGSNYDDTEKRVVGGRNGYGAKLTNVYSREFTVRVCDGEKSYKQTWRANMSEVGEAEVKAKKSKETYVEVAFQPDLKLFGMSELEEDIVSLMMKRVYDMAGIFGDRLKVFLNDTRIKIASFMKYIDLYFPEQDASIVKVYDKEMTTSRWEVLVSYSPTQFQQVSFVNSIATTKGGTHVNYVTDKLVQEIMNEISNNKKYKGIEIQKYQIKQSLWVFVNCLIDNPTFDSQTKENMTTKVSEFGGAKEEKFFVSEKFVKQLLKTDIVEAIVTQAKAKQNAKLNKHLKGTKQSKLRGIEKLDDANDAGKRGSEQCTLILTEGDSAKSFAMAGIDILGRDKFGVFPLKGKLLNVREASLKQIIKNEEIENLIKIIGLQREKQYDDLRQLRYGSVMIMTDQDIDGSHIKGLILNFIHYFWPSLIKYKGFLKEFVTPLIKVKKGSQVRDFFTVQDFEKFAEEQGEQLKRWTIKYYKGLGTSNDEEAKEYFSRLQHHQIQFSYVNNDDDNAIDLCFSKKKVQERKDWLSRYDSNKYVDHTQKFLRIHDFVDKEMIHFSMADNIRSIPSVIDGFKPGQRKILFCCFKRNLKTELKVQQLSGYVAEHSAYHHGEQSLATTIIGLAQNFVGSNNINLLMPNGQFGSRAQGGKDHASPRYVFTQLSKVTRYLFPENDDHTLNYLEDEGQMVEPEYYVPIIPMVLVNGAEGIGTGWSTLIPNYNPRDLIEQLKRRLNGEGFTEMHPWYKGYIGDIAYDGKGYNIVGKFEVNEEELQIDIYELPIRKWTKNYKEFLEKLIEEETIDDFQEYHTKQNVHFRLQLNKASLQKLLKNPCAELHLSTTMQISNMVAFDRNGKIRKYQKVEEILEEFYDIRLEYYKKRKAYLSSKLQREIEILDNKVRFILAVINEQVQLRNVKKDKVVQQLIALGTPSPLLSLEFTKQKDLQKILSTKLQAFGDRHKKEEEKEEESQSEPEEEDDNKLDKNQFDYLLSMPLMSLTYEKVEKLKKEQEKAKAQMKYPSFHPSQ